MNDRIGMADSGRVSTRPDEDRMARTSVARASLPAILLLLLAAPAFAAGATPTPSATPTATATATLTPTPTATPTPVSVSSLAFQDMLAIDRGVIAMLAFAEPDTYQHWTVLSQPVCNSAVTVISRDAAQLDPPCIAPAGVSPTNDIRCAAGASSGGAPSPEPSPTANGALIPGGTVYCFTTSQNTFLAQTSQIDCAATNCTRVWAVRRKP